MPEQRIAEGTVRFQVLMAHLTQVRVRGDATGAESVIAGYLNELTKQPVFNRYEAERYLLLASDLPGYTVRLTLRPAGTVAGDVIGDVTVQRTPAYADFNVQNGGSKALGRWGGLLRGQVFGLTGLGDRTTVSVFSTSDFKEQQTVQLGHDFHLGPNGLGISDSFTYAWARPTIPDAHVLAKTLLNTFEVDYPFVRRQAYSVRGSVGMDYVDQDVALNHIDLTRDRLRVGFLRLGFDSQQSDFSNAGFSLAEPQWRANAILELRQGMHILGATHDCGPTGADCLGLGDVPPSRLEGRSDATVLRYTMYGEVRPVPKLTLALGARAQYAWKPLLSFEEFSAGNYTAGRGYDPGALLGDKGFGSQAEIRYGSASRRASASRRSKAMPSGTMRWSATATGWWLSKAPSISTPSAAAPGSISTVSRSTRRSPSRSPASGSTTGSPTRASSSLLRPGCGHGATDENCAYRVPRDQPQAADFLRDPGYRRRCCGTAEGARAARSTASFSTS